MIEGRSGGSGRGTRRELWAPPDRGSSTSGSYVVSCTDVRPQPPTHFLPSAASSPSHLLLATGKNSAAPSARSARHSSPQNGGPKGKMIEGRSGGSEAEKEAGLLVQQLRSVIQEIANALLKNRSLNFADVERIYGPNNYKPAPDRFID